jgi:hypothetical protein
MRGVPTLEARQSCWRGEPNCTRILDGHRHNGGPRHFRFPGRSPKPEGVAGHLSHRNLKPHLRLDWRRQDSQDETQNPDHSASLSDSVTSSTRMKFSVPTAFRLGVVVLRSEYAHPPRLICLRSRETSDGRRQGARTPGPCPARRRLASAAHSTAYGTSTPFGSQRPRAKIDPAGPAGSKGSIRMYWV